MKVNIVLCMIILAFSSKIRVRRHEYSDASILMNCATTHCWNQI